MSPFLRLVPAGMLLIAVTYGLARFAYGLFLPEMRADVGLSSALAGVIGGGAYIGFAIAIVASSLLVERVGARAVAVAAGLVAASGMGLIALSQSPVMLAAAVLFAGMSTGLSSPPLADAVARRITPANQPRANTWINAATSLGVVVAGPVALAATGEWRAAYLMFALVGAVSAAWVLIVVPGRPRRAPADTADAEPVQGLWRPAALPALIAAAGMGIASAAYWTFAGSAIVDLGGLPRAVASEAWIVLGLAGLGGSAAGDLIRRFGINAVHRGSLLALAGGTLLIVLTPESRAAIWGSAALFGLAYMMLTGLYLVWGIRIFADRPAIGIGLPFLTIALGQGLGAGLAGNLIDAAGLTRTFGLFAAIGVLTMAAGYRPRDASARPRPMPVVRWRRRAPRASA
jgi:predicted MFS family arabinose efflux permease